MCIYIHICIHNSSYIYIGTYGNEVFVCFTALASQLSCLLWTCMHACLPACMYACMMYACMHACMRVCITCVCPSGFLMAQLCLIIQGHGVMQYNIS